MNVMRALVGVDRLQIGHVTHDVVFGGDAVGSVGVTCLPRNRPVLFRNCCA